MRKLRHFWLVLAVSLFAQANPLAAQTAPKQTPAPANRASTNRAGAAQALSLPLFFEANQGQTDPRVRFLTRGSGYTLFLTPTETVFAAAKAAPKGSARGIGAAPVWNAKAAEQAVVRMQLVGANSAPVMAGFEELPGKVNYLIGNDPAQWRTGVPLYSEVRSEQVYPGVDLLFHGDKKQLEYDFVISPGADPSKIAFRIRGAARIEVDSQGNLVLHTAGSEFRMYKPVVYQTVASERRAVEGSFVRKGKHEVAFQIGAYDRSQPLVIDPAIGYSTFLGGAGADDVEDLEVDKSNPAAPKVYVSGFTTDTTTFPETSNPLIGALGALAYGYVAKIDPTITSGGAGSLDYLTFVGGHVPLPGNSGTQCTTVFERFSLDLSQGTLGVEPVLGGLTSCSDYPGTPTQTVEGTMVGVLTRLTAAGSAVDVSIIFGGNGNNFDIYPFVDAAGNVIVAGGTSSTNYTATPGAYIPQMNNGGSGSADCFVAKLPRTNFLAPEYLTYLNAGAGTTGLNGSGIGCGANEEASGIIGVGGTTVSTVVFNVGAGGASIANGFEPDAPAGATLAAFAMALNPALTGIAQSVYGTYYGGGGITNPHTGTVELGNGLVAIGGFTTSNTAVGDIPLKNAFQSTNLAASDNGETGFLVVMDTTQTGAASLVCSTYFGGSSGSDEINALAYDPSDPTAFRILLGGATASAFDFPTANSLQSFAGTQDGFVAGLDVPLETQPISATLNFSTFIGGGNGDRIGGVGVDANGTMYAAGYTRSSNFFENTFPATTVNGFQTTCTSCGATQPQDDTVVFSLTQAAGATLQSILVSPVAATIPVNQTQQFQAEGYFSDGTVQNITTAAGTAWSSTQPTIASINGEGLATAGPTAGDATIVASNGNAVGEASVAVTAPGDFSLTIALNGSGYGSISDAPLGCNDNNGVVEGTCTAEYVSGTVLTLFAQPNTGSVFGGWSGGGCSGTATSCTVTLNANTVVTGTFNNGPGTNSIGVTPGAIANGLGTGTGTVTSSQFGISCSMTDGAVTGDSGACTSNFTDGSFVTLTATPAAGSVFNFWGGNCGASSVPTCKLLAYTPQTATATFTAVGYALQVVAGGTGSGTITSVPAGLSCALPSACSANFPIGTVVTLTATPNAGSTFGGWSNFGCTGTGTCTLTMTQAFAVVATFNPVGFLLTVTDQGSGAGGVLSSPAGVICDTGSITNCAVNFNTGTVVTLTATPSPPSTFAGWAGACSGTGTCTVTMNAAENVTATFNVSYALTVMSAGTGSGTVTSTPSGILCPSTCLADFSGGQTVTLTQVANAGFTFAGWSGACTGVGSCIVTMNAAESVTATFNVQTFEVTVFTDPPVSGTITSTPSGISCPNACIGNYTAGTSVTLSEIPQPGFTFAGWSGTPTACTGTGTTCTFSMPSASETVTATFNQTTTFALTVTDAGAGTGTVTSAPSGILCPSTCAANFTAGSQVTLTQVANSGSTFAGWSGACTGTGSCVVTMSAAEPVTATFNTTTTNDIRSAVVAFTDDGAAPVTVTWNPAFADTNYTAVCTAETTPSDFLLPVITGRTPTTMTVIPTDGGATPGNVDCIAIPDTDTSDLRHGRVAFTDLPATVTVPWSTAFPDTNYTVACTLETEAGIGGGFTSVISDIETGSVTVDNGQYDSGTMHCIGVPDTDTTGTRHGRVDLSGESGIVTVTWNTAFPNANYAAACSDVQIEVTSSEAAIAIDDGSKQAGSLGVNNEIGSGTINCIAVATTATTQFTVTVQEVGTGAGTVTSSPAGINCPETCSASFASGTPITLTATASAGSTFTGWTDDTCEGTGTCTFTVSGPVTLLPQFTASSFTLTVTDNGTGGGTVTSSPEGIDCGSGCSANFTSGTVVTLTATPSDGSTFAGWGGACSGTGSCVVTMNAAESVTATFNLPLPSYTLTVALTGTGAGTVTSSPAGINCADGSSTGSCTASYVSGTVVTLTATPAAGSAFAGWSGACSGTGSCVVTMSAAESVTATFNISTFTFAPGPGFSTTTTTTPGGNIVVGFTLSSSTPTTVGLACTSSAPKYLSCLITPAEVQLTGNGPSQVAIVLTSYCQGSAPGGLGGPGPGMPGGIVWLVVMGMGLCGAAWSYRGRRRWAMSFAVMLLAGVGAAACGSLPQGTAGATPPGNYVLTVTATVAGQAPQVVLIDVDVQ